MTHHTGSDEGHRYHVMDGIGGQWLAETTSEYPEPTGIGLIDDILRDAAPDALRERVEALADEWERTSRMDAFSSMSRFHWRERARDLRAALAERPTDGAGTCLDCGHALHVAGLCENQQHPPCDCNADADLTDGVGTCACIPVPAEPGRHFGGITVDPACPQHGAGA